MFIGSGSAVADGTKAIRAAGSRAQIATLSNNAAGGFIKLMGENAHGTVVTQVFPPERSMAAPIVKEASDLARASGRDGVTLASSGAETRLKRPPGSARRSQSAPACSAPAHGRNRAR